MLVSLLEVEEIVEQRGKGELVLVPVLGVGGLAVVIEPVGHGQIHLGLSGLDLALVKEKDAGAHNGRVEEVIAGKPGNRLKHGLLPHLAQVLVLPLLGRGELIFLPRGSRGQCHGGI